MVAKLRPTLDDASPRGAPARPIPPDPDEPAPSKRASSRKRAAEQTVEFGAPPKKTVTIDAKYFELASDAPIIAVSFIVAEVSERVGKKQRMEIAPHAHPMARAMRKDVVRQITGSIEMNMWAALVMVYVVELATCLIGFFIADKMSKLPPGSLDAMLASDKAKEMFKSAGLDPDNPDTAELIKGAKAMFGGGPKAANGHAAPGEVKG
jgi:uncharacterized protein YneF (UPF0154 family)